MTKATTRPTAAQLQQNQAKADRKAAAIARRQDDYRQDSERTTMYQQTETMKAIPFASIRRRHGGRVVNLRTLGLGMNDTHLILLEQLCARYSDAELKAMGLGQNAKLWKFDRIVADHFGFEPVVQQGVLDDPQADTDTPWMAWFYPVERELEVRDFIRTLVTA